MEPIKIKANKATEQYNEAASASALDFFMVLVEEEVETMGREKMRDRGFESWWNKWNIEEYIIRRNK